MLCNQLPPSQGKAKDSANDFHDQRNNGDAVYIGKLCVIVVADRAKRSTAHRLHQPAGKHHPGKPALCFNLTPHQRKNCAAYHCHGPEVVNDLGDRIGEVLEIQRYSTPTLMQRSTPMGVWFLLTILMQISWLPGDRVSIV